MAQEAFVVTFTAAQSAGGQRNIGGETTIGWEPSDSEVAVKVTIMFQGTTIGVKTLNSTDLTMDYHGTSGEDFTKGRLKAKFGANGKSGQIDSVGALTWSVSGSSGSYTGFIGEWKV
jgi:hypothetical protein